MNNTIQWISLADVTTQGDEGIWCGSLKLDLTNQRDWRSGEAEITLTHDLVLVHVHGVLLSAPGRDELRSWLAVGDRAPEFQVGRLTWRRRRASVAIRYAVTFHRIRRDCLDQLLKVL